MRAEMKTKKNKKTLEFLQQFLAAESKKKKSFVVLFCKMLYIIYGR